MASYELQTKIAGCFSGSPAETAGRVRIADFFKGRGKALALKAMEEVAAGNSPAATFWGAVRDALTAPVPSGPSNPMEAAFGQSTTAPVAPVAPSALGQALVSPPKKAAKKATKKATKKVDRSQPVYRAVHKAARAAQAANGGSSAVYKNAYNQALVAVGLPAYYA